MSDSNYAVLLQAYGNGTEHMASIMRCSGLFNYPCAVCSWTLMHECPTCYQEQQYFRNTPDLSGVCPIVLSDTKFGCHWHCYTSDNVCRIWTPLRITIVDTTGEQGGQLPNQLPSR